MSTQTTEQPLPAHPDPSPTHRAAPGVIVLYSDIVCPWAHIATHRLTETRDRLGADVQIDHRAFPLELLDGRPTPRAAFDDAVAMGLDVEPDAGWAPWQAPEAEFPVTSLMALEAVQAAKAQSPAAAEALDRALRSAFWLHHECISILPVVLDVADRTLGVDRDELAHELWSGRPRCEIRRQTDEATSDEVRTSPHLFISGPDGASQWTNPGIELDGPATEFRVAADDRDVYTHIVEAALAARSHEAG